MAQVRDSSPVYYREIQKNAYLKRVPDEVISKPLGLRPLGLNKKAPLKPLWTQLCIHNGRTPYLEQYRDPTSARAHRPVWRASLMTARHVTASVTPRDNQHDFLIDTDDGPVRMLAPDWDTMQDWVLTLRNKLHELRIVPLCENVYCAPPAAQAPRAAARDPTSPLPPTPPLPPDRVPGIDLTPIIRSSAVQATQPETTVPQTSDANTANVTTTTSTPNSNVSNSNSTPSSSAYSSIAPNLPPGSSLTTLNTVSSASATIGTSQGNNKSVTVSNKCSTPKTLAVSTCSIANTLAISSTSLATQSTSLTAPTTSLTSPITSLGAATLAMAAPNLAIPAEEIDISSWETPESETPFTSLPSTSQVPKSVAKICGQNICLDDSIFKRTFDSDDDDFLSEGRSSKSGSVGSKSDISRNDACIKNDVLNKDRSKITTLKCKIDSSSYHSDSSSSQTDKSKVSEVNSFKQTLVVSDKPCDTRQNGNSERSTNITVIQVSNKEPPHTAIPVIGSETDIFNFNIDTEPKQTNFVNIVNTEVNVQNSNDYGTVFTKNEPEYGHISLTTTVSLTGDVRPKDAQSSNDGVYEKLCLASTSKEAKASPLPVRKIRNQEKNRKSSLPNLDTINSDPLYEYLFLSQNNSVTNVVTSGNNVTTSTANATTNRGNVDTTSSSTTTLNNATPTRNVTTAANNVTTISTNVNSSTENHNSRINISSGPILDLNTRALRCNIERSHSQNAYDASPRREARIEQNVGPKRNIKIEKIEPVHPKPIWKRGLTELSLLTRLRGITQSKRNDSPERQNERNPVTSPAKVVHRSRPETRVDRNRRRSSSLSNGQSPPSTSVPASLQPLHTRQAAVLRNEQRRGAAIVAPCRTLHPPVFADYNKQVWVAWWGNQGARFSGRAGDRVCGVRGVMPRDSAHARELVANAHVPTVDILFYRVPLGKIYVVNKRDQESIGIKIDSECNITSVESESPAAAAGIPPPGKWAVTELNNRPLNLIKVDTEDINRLTLRGTEASVLIHPSALVKKLRAAIKGNKTLLGLR